MQHSAPLLSHTAWCFLPPAPPSPRRRPPCASPARAHSLQVPLRSYSHAAATPSATPQVCCALPHCCADTPPLPPPTGGAADGGAGPCAEDGAEESPFAPLGSRAHFVSIARAPAGPGSAGTEPKSGPISYRRGPSSWRSPTGPTTPHNPPQPHPSARGGGGGGGSGEWGVGRVVAASHGGPSEAKAALGGLDTPSQVTVGVDGGCAGDDWRLR